MTTFQAVIYAVSQSIGQFFPIGAQGQHALLPYILGWSPPMEGLLGVLSLGSLLSLVVYFRHDWASMISCFLQVLIYRRRPMTLDERMPFFIGITTLPMALASLYFRDRLSEIQWSPLSQAAVFAVVALPLWFCDRVGRKNKNMVDWTWKDALWIGFIQVAAILPICDPLSTVLFGALFLNYRRESAAKYAFFAAAPLLLTETLVRLKDVHLHTESPAADLSWLSFGVAGIVSLFAGLLVIGGFMKHIQTKGLGHYVAYRWILALGVCALVWIRK